MLFKTVVRHACHRNRVGIALVAAGQGNAQQLRGFDHIIEKQLEKVTHAHEQQAVRILCLGLTVLLHHGGVAAHGHWLNDALWGTRELGLHKLQMVKQGMVVAAALTVTY